MTTQMRKLADSRDPRRAKGRPPGRWGWKPGRSRLRRSGSRPKETRHVVWASFPVPRGTWRGRPVGRSFITGQFRCGSRCTVFPWSRSDQYRWSRPAPGKSRSMMDPFSDCLEWNLPNSERLRIRKPAKLLLSSEGARAVLSGVAAAFKSTALAYSTLHRWDFEEAADRYRKAAKSWEVLPGRFSKQGLYAGSRCSPTSERLARWPGKPRKHPAPAGSAGTI